LVTHARSGNNLLLFPEIELERLLEEMNLFLLFAR